MSGESVLVRFGDVVDFVGDRVSHGEVNAHNYVSTNNMIPNFGGVCEAKTLPHSGSVRRFQVGDVLFSNIRPYLKKIWVADFDGYCSNDVLVFRSKDSRVLLPSILHGICRSDAFIAICVESSKGVRMPRGDKERIADFTFLLPPITHQLEMAAYLESVQVRITHNLRENDHLNYQARSAFSSWFQQ